jgi:carboxypeptidase Taq
MTPNRENLEMRNTYEMLTDELKRIHALAEVAGLLEWDEQVNLPKSSVDFRARQCSAMAEIVHRESTADKIGRLIGELEEDAALDADRKIVVKEARKNYDRKTKIPGDFVAGKAAHLSKSYHAWVEARERDDFPSYAPFLETNIRLAKEEAAFLGHSDNPYDYWIDCFDPGLDATTIEKVFKGLEAELVPLAREILDSPIKADTSCLKGFPIEKQEAFMRQVTGKLGFDYSMGRIDKSVHPFCSGCGFDTRMTTRFFEDNPLDSLFSSIHETGHGLYEQGLPKEHIGTALGQAAGMAAHESQSRLWENQVARSREFWQYWEPFYRETFPGQLREISSEGLYLAINSVSLNPIRVDSDEVTYNLHILLRFRIEKALFDGSLLVKDLPGEWNRLSKDIIGLDPANDKEGVLQDVHWSGAAFGYFPSYCLGNLLAAQLWYTLLDQVGDVPGNMAKGEFGNILGWLRENVHQHGQKHFALELAKESTGQELSHHSLIRYLKERYLPLYRA